MKEEVEVETIERDLNIFLSIEDGNIIVSKTAPIKLESMNELFDNLLESDNDIGC